MQFFRWRWWESVGGSDKEFVDGGGGNSWWHCCTFIPHAMYRHSHPTPLRSHLLMPNQYRPVQNNAHRYHRCTSILQAYSYIVYVSSVIIDHTYTHEYIAQVSHAKSVAADNMECTRVPPNSERPRPTYAHVDPTQPTENSSLMAAASATLTPVSLVDASFLRLVGTFGVNLGYACTMEVGYIGSR